MHAIVYLCFWSGKVLKWRLICCRARGIHPDAARQILVHSFGAEVTQHLKHKNLLDRIQSVVASTLSKAPLVAAESVHKQVQE